MPPRKLYLCRCDVCSVYTTLDAHGLVVKGSMVPKNTRTSHNNVQFLKQSAQPSPTPRPPPGPPSRDGIVHIENLLATAERETKRALHSPLAYVRNTSTNIFEFDVASPVNVIFRAAEDVCSMARFTLDNDLRAGASNAIDRLRGFRSELDRLGGLLIRYKEEERTRKESAYDTDPYFFDYRRRSGQAQKQAIALLINHYFYKSSQGAHRLLVEAFNPSPLPDGVSTTDSLVPKTLSTLITDYRLSPKTKGFACCATCFSLHPLLQPAGRRTQLDGTGDTDGHRVEGGGYTFPRTCDAEDIPGSLCGHELGREKELKDGHRVMVPELKYFHRSLHDWVASITTRPGIENVLQDYKNHANKDEMDDIWDSPFFWEFKGKDGEGFMAGGEPGELRLLFGLGVDGFNPYGSKQAKQIVTSTAIYMVLYNLPPHLRYKPENIYLVGVIPGHPSTHQINRSLKLLVDDLLEFWDGVSFTKTSLYPKGRRILAALALVICDMLAARQVSGYSSSTSTYFCTFCNLTYQELHNFDRTTWVKRDWETMKNHARSWLNATSVHARDDIVRNHGVRWSALNSLPYWDPTRCTVPDALHFSKLGLLQEHIRRIFKIDVNVEGGDGSWPVLDILRPPREDLLIALAGINLRPYDRTKEGEEAVTEHKAFISFLERFKTKVLKAICFDNNLPFAGRKSKLSAIIAEHKRDNGVDLVLGGMEHDYSGTNTEGTASESALSQSSAASGSSAGTATTQTADRARKEERLYRLHLSKFRRGTVTLKGLQNMTRRELNKLAEHHGVSTAGFNKNVAERLHQHMLENFEIAQKDHVLGTSVMEEIRNDIKVSILPKAVKPAPLDWGTAARGKLSGEQWYVLGVVHLPITLIRIWGYPPSVQPPTGNLNPDMVALREARKQRRMKELLDNYIDLVKAVVMANNRRTSKEHVKSYETHLFKYYSHSSSLYRALQNKPIQHMAGHFGECLASMGPAHAYQTSAFERVNGLLQDINTNGKIGEMEATFLNHYSEAAMLAGILASDTVTRDSAEEVIRQHERHSAKKSLSSAMMHEDLSVGDGVRGTRVHLGSEVLANLAELFGLEEHSLEAEWSLFPMAVLDSVEYVASGGNRTTVSGSYVMLHHNSPSDLSTALLSSSQVRAALIIHICRDRNHDLRVTYRLFNTSIPLEQDVYRELDMGHLTSRTLEEPLYVTEVKNIVCPCVATEMNILGQCVMHILPYDRKRPPFSTVSHSNIRQADQLETVFGGSNSELQHRSKRKRYV